MHLLIGMDITKQIAKTLVHPIGKYVIMMGKPSEGMFLLEHCNSFGAPSKECSRFDENGDLKYTLKANPIKYFDSKNECISKLSRIMYEWRCVDNVYKITDKGFRKVLSGKDVV